MLQIVLLLTLMYTSSGLISIPNATGNLEVYVLPVGQGDCTIIQCPAGQLVINDCGSNGGNRLTVQEVQTYLGQRVNDVVAILISHAHTDHYNYLYNITNSTNTNIRSVIIGGELNDYKRNRIRGWLSNFNGTGKLFLINNGRACMGNCSVIGGTNFCNNSSINFTILAANVGSRANQKSIVLKVTFGTTFSILLPGDIEGTAATTVATWPPVRDRLQSLIYKMAHHGASSLANQPEWLDPIKPKRVFASNGYNFRFCRHPRCDTITRLVYLGTIDPATSHPFYCSNLTSTTNYSNYMLHMYETSPTPDLICFLTYSSSLTDPFHVNCIIPPTAAQMSQDLLDDDECTLESITAHAVSLLAQYLIIVTVAVLSILV